ncbi:hypothetical protein, partial [Phocaeicola plebeius]|uniref:hypothetical protein n=1 Tax=Phocaeicola plebeius TaxID=310297 RepID=UPI003AF11028
MTKYTQEHKITMNLQNNLERGCVKMMHPLFRYRTIGFSFFIEYDLFFPVSMLSGGTICRRWLTPP